MRRAILLVIIVVAARCDLLLCQVQPLRVRGATHLGEPAIRQLLQGLPVSGLVPGSPAADSAAALVAAAYAGEGYLAARVTIDTIGSVAIDEGMRYRVRSVRLVPDSAAAMMRDDASDVVGLSGEWFSTGDIEAAIRRMLRLLTLRGYPLAAVRVGDVAVDDSAAGVDVTLIVDPGERVRIEEVDVRGNTTTRRRLILTAAAIEPGSLFTDAFAAQVRARLVRLNLFSEVAEPQLYRTDSGRYGVMLTVQEGSPNTFDGVVGYQPGEGGSGGSLTGLVNVIFRNILGTGRRAAFRWQKQTATASLLEIRYGEPFLFGIPLDLDLTFRQTQEETTPALLSYVQRVLAGDFSYGLTDAFTIRLGGSYESTIPQIDTLAPCSRQLLDAGTFETTLGVLFDTRSSTVNPVSGVRFSTSYALGAKTIGGASPCDTGLAPHDTRQRAEFDLDAFVPAFRSFVVAGGLHYGEVRADNLDESDLFRFGGQSTVRGYLEGVFRASRRAWSSVEVRLLLSTSSYAAVFFDAGYYERAADPRREIERQTGWIDGFGVAAQVETPLGLIRLSYALGRDDTFATGKVFAGLVNQF